MMRGEIPKLTNKLVSHFQRMESAVLTFEDFLCRPTYSSKTQLNYLSK